MTQCFYCRHENPSGQENCQRCGMPLPEIDRELRSMKRQMNFTFFCIALTLFCLIMMLWLPRTITS